jgi:EmrB/QacA subfamily drug resistance transporter
VALANFLVPLNSTMIVAALPSIARDLAVDRATSAWLVTAYLIAMASLQPIAGRIGDRYGRRRVLLAALFVFAAASAAAPLAHDFVVLVAFRLLQALGGATITPNAMGLLRGQAVAGKAGMYFGIVGATSGVGASAGPLLGSLLASVDWRWIFVVNVPLVAAILALGWTQLPRIPGHRTAPPDVVGAASLAVLLVLPAWLLSTAGGGLDATRIALLVAMHIGFILFFRYERRHPDPVLPPSIFRVRAFSAANLTIALSNFSLYGAFIALPIALSAGADAAVRTGVVLTAFSLGSIVLSPLSGVLVDRFGARVPTALGGSLIALGFGALALTGISDLGLLLAGVFVAGSGITMNFPATRIAALDAAPPHLAGLASGVTSTSRYFGGISGTLLAAILVGRSDDLSALPVLLAIFAAAGLGSALIGVTLPRHVAMHAEPEPEPTPAD